MNVQHLKQYVPKHPTNQKYSKRNMEIPVQTHHIERKWTHYSRFWLGLWEISESSLLQPC